MKSFLSLILLLVGLQSPTFALDFQDPAAFEKGLASVERSMDKGQWEKSSKALLKLLDEHAKADYVFLEKQRILDDMERISLFLKYDPPTADDVLAGDVKKYDPEKGKIEVTFKGEDLSDFIENGGAYTLPVAFTGPYTIEMSGARYPVNDPLSVVIGFRTTNEWIIAFGSKEYKPYVVWIHEGEEDEMIETSEKQPIKMGQPYNLMIEVKNTKVSVKVDKKKLFSLKRQKGDYGVAAFYGFRDYERESLVLKLKGELEPSWIAGKIDAVMQERLAEFEDMYSPENVLPDWLFDESLAGGDSGSSGGSLRSRTGDKGKSNLRPETSFRDYPGPEMSGDGESAFEFISEEIFSEDSTFDELIESIDDAVADEELSEVAADSLRMYIMYVYGMVEDAATAGERMMDGAGDHLPAMLKYVEVLTDAREFDRARELLHSAKEQWPQSWRVLESLIVVEVFDKNMEVAQDLLREARSKRIMGASGEELSNMINKAISGPHWPKTYSFKSKHYIIESDISEALCKEAAGLLEGAYTSYSVRLKRIKGLDKNKFRVFIFSGEASYQRYVGDSLSTSAENSLGLYSPFMKQLLIWNAPERESMMRTIVHEGFHQYLDMAAYPLPRWFNEGMAEYIERAEIVNGRWTDGHVREDHLEVLDQYGVLPIASIVTMTYERFASGNVFWHYSNSWALIHFLRNSTKENEAIFDSMFEGFLESPSSRHVIFNAFDGVDFEQMDKDFIAYLNELNEK